jgi:hypothetical protein
MHDALAAMEEEQRSREKMARAAVRRRARAGGRGGSPSSCGLSARPPRPCLERAAGKHPHHALSPRAPQVSTAAGRHDLADRVTGDYATIDFMVKLATTNKCAGRAAG